jgi:hypothetical protein
MLSDEALRVQYLQLTQPPAAIAPYGGPERIAAERLTADDYPSLYARGCTSAPASRST